jgi:hypothetical protein
MIALEVQKEKRIMVVADLETGRNYLLPLSNFFRIRKKYPHLRNRPLVIGFIGPRGSGKSVNTARMSILDYMMEGKQVWANMEIGCQLGLNGHHHIIQADNWDKIDIIGLENIYDNGCIVIEEANMTMMEARRAMRDENIRFSYVLQQLRKRKMNIIWNAQSENHVDDRMRYQTDIFVKCADVSLLPGHRNVGVGELTLCKYYDYSGVVTGDIKSRKGFIEPFFECIVANKPWWNSFNTWQLQMPDDAVLKEQEAEANSYLTSVADNIFQMIQDNDGEIDRKQMWHDVNISTRSEQIKIGQLLSAMGIEQNYNHSKYVMKVYE